MKVGYVRISKHIQNKQLQLDALGREGCEKIFIDEMTGTTREREQLKEALSFLRPGDTLVVWKFDRMARSLKNMIDIANELREKGIEFVSITEKVDTSTPGGKLIFHMMAALAEFEHDLIKERSIAGLEAAREQGKQGGRPKVLDEKQKNRLQRLARDKSFSVQELCGMFGISQATYYRTVKKHQD